MVKPVVTSRKVATFLALSLILAGSNAFAAGFNNTNNNTNTNANLNLNANLSHNELSNVNKNWVNQDQYQSQFNYLNSRGDKNDVRVTSTPNLSGLVASPHTCMGSVSVSGGGGGLVSLGVGTTYRDRECDLREAIKLAAQLGLTKEAVSLFYQLEAVRGVNNTTTTVTNNNVPVTGVRDDLGRESGTRETSMTLVDWLRSR